MDFDEVYNLVEKSSHETAFNRAECEALWEHLSQVPMGGNIVEIGLQFGRSATVMGIAARLRYLAFYGIDNWEEEASIEARKHIEDYLIGELDLPINLINENSKVAWKSLFGIVIDLIHIDGDHTYEGVKSDCEIYLPRVKVGGYACFDDYGHDSLPGVYKAVNEYMSQNHHGWRFIGRYGNKLGVYKRVA